jgi:hypothetical protein
MLKNFIACCAIITLISCGRQSQEQSSAEQSQLPGLDTVAVVSDPKSNLYVQTDDFSEVDSSGILVFPLSMGQMGRGGDGLIYKSVPERFFWNLIFLNGRTNERYLLSEQKMIIQNYDLNFVGNADTGIETGKRYIFYEIINDDHNKDRELNLEDPTYLFLTNKEGKQLRQISPTGYDLNNWRYVHSLRRIFMTVRKDSDQNGKFDEKDEVATFSIDIEREKDAVEVFPQEFKNKLKVLFDRDWKSVKK